MKPFSARERIIIFLFIFVLGIILSAGLSIIPSLFSELSLSELANTDSVKKLSPTYLRLQLFLSHLGMFLIPSFVFGWYVYGRKHFLKGFDLNEIPKIQYILFAFLLLIFCYPLVNLLHYINTMLPLADWMKGAEQNVKEILNTILSADHAFVLVLNILLISVMPAIGEELIFRGIIQKNTSAFFKNGHIGVWIGAILFSAIHMQFEGFLARMALGAILGYSYYFTKNLWVPIILHFINNLIPILFFMLLDMDITNTENLQDNVSWAPLVISFLGVPALIYYFTRLYGKPREDYA